MKTRNTVILSFYSLLALLSFGCQGPYQQNTFTRNRFEMIKIGSTDKSQGELALGKPLSIPSLDVWYYREGNTSAIICFDTHDMVRSKRWANSLNGETLVEP